MAENVRWITAAEAEATFAPIGSGGIGGSIANKQVAFGNGTEIAGNSQFSFEKSGNFYSIYLSGFELDWDDDAGQAIFSGGQIIIRGSSVVLGNGQHSPAASGDIRLQNNFALKARNHTDGGDVVVLRVDTSDSVILGSDSDHVAVAPGGISIGTTGDINLEASGGAVNITTALALLPSDDPPASPTEGMIYADTDHHLYYYNGTTWKQLDNTL